MKSKRTLIERLEQPGADLHDAPSCFEIMAEAAAELRRLQATVDRLPKTADGVAIVPGDSVFLWDNQTLFAVGVLTTGCGGEMLFGESASTRLRRGHEVYSTREAAEKARKR